MKICRNGHNYYIFHWRCKKDKPPEPLKLVVINHKNKFKIDRKLDEIEQRKEEIWYYWIKSPQKMGYEGILAVDTKLNNLYKEAEELI